MGPWTQQISEKLHCSLGKIMKNRQVLVCGVLESTIDLRSIYVGRLHFKKLMKFKNLLKYSIVAWPGSGTRIRFLLIIFIDKNHFKEREIWDNVILRNILNSTISVNILLWHDQTYKHESECFYAMSIHKNDFKKQKCGTESV